MAWAAAGGQAASGLVGGLFATGLASQANKNAKKAARRAYERAVKAYRHRYQWTMQDMREAGLNPILAAQGGLGGPGAGVGASPAQVFNAGPQVADSIAGGMSRATEAYMAKKRSDLMKEQEKLADANRLESISRNQSALAQAQYYDQQKIGQSLQNDLDRLRNAFYKANPEVRNMHFIREATGSSLASTLGLATGDDGNFSAKGLQENFDKWMKNIGKYAPAWVPDEPGLIRKGGALRR